MAHAAKDINRISSMASPQTRKVTCLCQAAALISSLEVTIALQVQNVKYILAINGTLLQLLLILRVGCIYMCEHARITHGPRRIVCITKRKPQKIPNTSDIPSCNTSQPQLPAATCARGRSLRRGRRCSPAGRSRSAAPSAAREGVL